MKWAGEAGLTGRSYVWIATQSVIGESSEALPNLPAGMLGKDYQNKPYLEQIFCNFVQGVSFDTSLSNLISQISTAMMVFVHGAESFIEDSSNSPGSLVPHLSCDSASDQQDSQETRWTLGETFHKYDLLYSSAWKCYSNNGFFTRKWSSFLISTQISVNLTQFSTEEKHSKTIPKVGLKHAKN